MMDSDLCNGCSVKMKADLRIFADEVIPGGLICIDGMYSREAIDVLLVVYDYIVEANDTFCGYERELAGKELLSIMFLINKCLENPAGIVNFNIN